MACPNQPLLLLFLVLVVTHLRNYLVYRNAKKSIIKGSELKVFAVESIFQADAHLVKQIFAFSDVGRMPLLNDFKDKIGSKATDILVSLLFKDKWSLCAVSRPNF